jgi:hypothetical protein
VGAGAPSRDAAVHRAHRTAGGQRLIRGGRAAPRGGRRPVQPERTRARRRLLPPPGVLRSLLPLPPRPLSSSLTAYLACPLSCAALLSVCAAALPVCAHPPFTYLRSRRCLVTTCLSAAPDPDDLLPDPPRILLALACLRPRTPARPCGSSAACPWRPPRPRPAMPASRRPRTQAPATPAAVSPRSRRSTSRRCTCIRSTTRLRPSRSASRRPARATASRLGARRTPRRCRIRAMATSTARCSVACTPRCGRRTAR